MSRLLPPPGLAAGWREIGLNNFCNLAELQLSSTRSNNSSSVTEFKKSLSSCRQKILPVSFRWLANTNSGNSLELCLGGQRELSQSRAAWQRSGLQRRKLSRCTTGFVHS